MVTQSIFPLRLTDVVVRKRAKLILDHINCSFDESGFSIVMGPNGSGKTTLLRLLHGLEHPRAGSVNWNIANVDAHRLQSFVFQEPVMLRRSVISNVAYPLIVRGLPKAISLERANHWLDRVGLAASHKLAARFLSGGEKQKLAIARALICEPQVLFLDEPTTNLDGRSTREIETLLMNARAEGTKVIMTTHNIGQAQRLATDIMFINNGKICEQTKAEQFFNQPNSPQAQAYLKGDIVE